MQNKRIRKKIFEEELIKKEKEWIGLDHSDE